MPVNSSCSQNFICIVACHLYLGTILFPASVRTAGKHNAWFAYLFQLQLRVMSHFTFNSITISIHKVNETPFQFSKKMDGHVKLAPPPPLLPFSYHGTGFIRVIFPLWCCIAVEHNNNESYIDCMAFKENKRGKNAKWKYKMHNVRSKCGQG